MHSRIEKLTGLFTDSEEQKERFRQNPEDYLEYRKNIEHELNSRFRFIPEGQCRAETGG
jgi:hypothetical protein